LWIIFSMWFRRWAWWSTWEQLYMKEIHELWEKHRAKFLFMFFLFLVYGFDCHWIIIEFLV
jgi:hypothetical protein